MVTAVKEKEPEGLEATAEAAMSAADFVAWQEAMGFKTRAKAARALGYSVRMLTYWERGETENGRPMPVPRAVGLACSALFHRLGPWRPEA